MKIFLAGAEEPPFALLCKIAGIKNVLFSYYHWLNNSPGNRSQVQEILNSSQMEVICDSGLFTMMFGVGKGGDYNLDFMRDYTRKYIDAARGMGISNLTIVESDVHKLLGIGAVFELRKYFEDCGMPVLYVWHKEEGIDGLMRMSERYDYIAISIPELRSLFKDNEKRYQTITIQLLQQIRRHNSGRIPKIHLLGNTVQETMETTLAYSCDSTSWLAGGRFGKVISFINGKLKGVQRSSESYRAWESQVFPKFKRELAQIDQHYSHSDSYRRYQISNLYSAMTMRQYQEYLDKYFPFSKGRT